MHYRVRNPQTGSLVQVEASSVDHALHVAEMAWRIAPTSPNEHDMTDGYAGVWLTVEEI